MKVVFEVPLRGFDHKKSQFLWLNNKYNWLFVIEDGKRMRTLSTDHEPGKELQLATLADGRTCTNLSWSRDGSLLALVVDKRQIYFWEIRSNNFTHFKPANRVNPNNTTSKRGNKSKEVELVVWSKISNRLVISHSNGQLLLCDCDSNISEIFIDNSDGVLRKVSVIESCEHLDIFVCLTIISEVLVMTFDGDTKFYIQCNDMTIVNAKFSMPFRDLVSSSSDQRRACAQFQVSGQQQRQMDDQSFWLAYQSKNEKLYLKKVRVNEYSFIETTSKADIVYNGGRIDAQLVDFYWLSANHLIVCFSSGLIVLLQIKIATNAQQIAGFSLVSDEILNISREDSGECFRGATQTPNSDQQQRQNDDNCSFPSSMMSSDCSFKSFKVMNCSQANSLALANRSSMMMTTTTTTTAKLDDYDRTRSFSLAAITSHKLFYYEVFQIEQQPKYSFERVDDLDLTKSLQKIDLKLERVDWCFDCSMLAVQLTNGHILVYRTRLQDYMVASYGSKTAYLSGTNEITILNYGSKVISGSDNGSQRENTNSDIDDSSQQRATTSKVSGSSRSIRSDSRDLAAEEETNSNPVGRATSPIPTVRGDNALVINVDLKPSVMAIGPEHLAVALNNRVRLYLISRSRSTTTNSPSASTTIPLPFYEQEYVSIVVALSLCSRFIAVHFNDGRLKLHAIQSRRLFEKQISYSSGNNSGISSMANRRAQPRQTTNEPVKIYSEDFLMAEDDEAELGDERFFPDPAKPERISAFILTEELLIYCTEELHLSVFSLKNWIVMQTCEHSKQFDRSILKLKANERGNKFVCLLKEIIAPSATKGSRSESKVGIDSKDIVSNDNEDNVFLYDLYTNRMINFAGSDLYEKIFDSQLATLSPSHPQITTPIDHQITAKQSNLLAANSSNSTHRKQRPKLNRISDAIWDTDGRTVLLVERKSIHISVVLGHTLEREEPIIVYVSSANKASSYTTLYASQGIVSFQTSLGRVINSVLDSHDDELKLTQLEGDVQAIIESTDLGRTKWEAQADVMGLKLAYLGMILPIYSLSKCKEICEHLMNDDQFNFLAPNERKTEIDVIIWRQLAAWALFTMNLKFAMLIYQKNGLLVNAHVLSEIIEDLRRNRGLDAKSIVKTRLLVLLGCDMNDYE